MIRVLLGLALMTGTAQAGAWAEFEQRCLLAYENGVPAITEGLVEAPIPGLAEHEVAFSGLTDGALMILESQPGDGFSACRVFFAQDAEAGIFKNWVREQLADNRYVPDAVTQSDAEIALLSHEWIEPVVGVQLRQTRGGHELRVVETELES